MENQKNQAYKKRKSPNQNYLKSIENFFIYWCNKNKKNILPEDASEFLKDPEIYERFNTLWVEEILKVKERKNSTWNNSRIEYNYKEIQAKRCETLGPDGLREARRKQIETMGPEGLKEAKRKQMETMGPEGRSKAAKKGAVTLGSEGCKLRSKKASETMGASGLCARAKKSIETLGEDGLHNRALLGANFICVWDNGILTKGTKASSLYKKDPSINLVKKIRIDSEEYPALLSQWEENYNPKNKPKKPGLSLSDSQKSIIVWSDGGITKGSKSQAAKKNSGFTIVKKITVVDSDYEFYNSEWEKGKM